jgi:hypothetical protein
MALLATNVPIGGDGSRKRSFVAIVPHLLRPVPSLINPLSTLNPMQKGVIALAELGERILHRRPFVDHNLVIETKDPIPPEPTILGLQPIT